MAEPSASESSAGTDSDQDFDPSAEMMVNDFDDEHTLDEEEAIAEEDSKEEIDELTKEGNMPIEELLALYGYNNNQEKNSEEGEIEEKTSDSSASNSNQSTSQQSTSQQPSSSNNAASSSSLAAARSSANYANLSDYSDSESDEEYSANEDEWRRTIQVGSDYQAVVPEGLSHYDDENDEKSIKTRGLDQNRDILIWKPIDTLSDKLLDDYITIYEGYLEDEQTIPLGDHSKDDDQALFLLFSSGYDVKEALQKHDRCPNPPPDQSPVRAMMAPWTEEECRNFEHGFRTYGKDFFQIKHNNIPTRTVGEVATFYYFWKKTERHDAFMAQQTAVSSSKLEKKKYALHPGTTDYMDRFLDEQENMTLYQAQNNSAITSSLNSTNSLLHSSHNHNHLLNLSSSSSSRQSTSTLGLNSAQSRHHSNHHHSHHNNQNDSYFAGNNTGSSGSMTISGNNMRTINVNASDNKPVVVCTGGSSSSGSSRSSSYYRHNTPSHHSSHRHSSHHQNSANDATTTIVVGKNPVVIDGAWVSSGSGSGATSNSPTSLSTPSVSIYKIPNNSSGFNR